MQVLNPEGPDGYVSEDKLRARDIGLKKLQLRNLRYHHPLSFDELNYAIEGVFEYLESMNQLSEIIYLLSERQ